MEHRGNRRPPEAGERQGPGEWRSLRHAHGAEGRPLDEQEVSLPGWRCEFTDGWENKEDMDERLGRAIGFAASPVAVRRFSFHAHRGKGPHYYPHLWVEPLPERMGERLRRWRTLGFGRSHTSLADVLDVYRWLATGRYVLHFGNDYWVNNEGEVTDS
jgi:hypothetical protein